jgi:8-oxo-dGTP pyrophosphatase MutT (NUDIX family)
MSNLRKTVGNMLGMTGHLDPGEDDMTAAMRETKEEAGLSKVPVPVAIILKVYLHTLYDKHHLMWYELRQDF